MDKKVMVIVGIILVVVLLVICMFLPGKKEKKYEEKLLGINYDTVDNEEGLNYETEEKKQIFYIYIFIPSGSC